MNRAASVFRQNIGEENWQRLTARLRELNHDVLTHGIKPYRNQVRLLTGYSYGEFYDWDLYFENVYLSYYGLSRYCRVNLEAFLDNQLASGFVARTLIDPRLRHHFKPFLAQTALLGYHQTGNCEWLRGKHYARLKKYVEYWFWYLDFDKNGLCVWDNADHSGMDNQVSRGGHATEVEGVDLNCYLVRELEAMAIIAGALGFSEDAKSFQEHGVALRALINSAFWDEEDGFYYDRNERSGELVKVKSVAGFIPLWLGIVPGERAQRLITEHLANADEFWLRYPVASYAKTEPDYYQQRRGNECNWCGPTWIPTNYMVFHGLMKQGFRDTARQLAYKTFDLVLGEETTREYYDAETGVGQGLNPFWGWSSLGYLMPLEYELEYDPTQISGSEVKPIATELLGLSLPSPS